MSKKIAQTGSGSFTFICNGHRTVMMKTRIDYYAP